MALYQPMRPGARAARAPARVGAGALLAAAGVAAVRYLTAQDASLAAFVAPRGLPSRLPYTTDEVLRRGWLPRRAAEVEAEVERSYPPEAYQDYKWNEQPDQAWFARNKIDKKKVKKIFWDMFRKPVSFFPHKLQPGDTVRVTYLVPNPKGDGDRFYPDMRSYDVNALNTATFDGVVMAMGGKKHFSDHGMFMTVRGMVGKGLDVQGIELKFPMHSPLVKSIDVLRRGYIGRARNAYFIRGLIGKKNAIPVDPERTEMDNQYRFFREQDMLDKIPESTYPKREFDRFPLPQWKQDEPDWDESKYDPNNVDQRTDWEISVIGGARKRLAPGDHPGYRRGPRNNQRKESKF